MANTQLPKTLDLLLPTLRALEAIGGSASIRELSEQMATDLALSDAVLDIPHLRRGRPSRQSEFEYRGAWSRTYLKNAGLIENASHGIWTITDKGRTIQTEEEVRKLARRKPADAVSDSSGQSAIDADGGAPGDAEHQDWKEDLLGIIRSVEPEAFERLCGVMLRKAGFTSVEITGRSGDGGIDGVGVLRVNLISFHMIFQCKRFSGTVGAGAVRDFRGAMVGRADKGLFITTGRFTHDATREAVRAGAPPIDLIDGSGLCDLLNDLGLGIETVPTSDQSFFDQL